MRKSKKVYLDLVGGKNRTGREARRIYGRCEMSVQGFKIIGIGHLMKSGSVPSNFNVSDEDFYDFVNEIGLDFDYYRMKDIDEKKRNVKVSPIGVVTCPMGNKEDNYFIGIVLYAHYLENTHGDDPWSKSFRNDSWVKDTARRRIKTVFGIDKEPEQIEFEYWG